MLRRSRRLLASLLLATLGVCATVAAQTTTPGAPGRFLFGADYPAKPADNIKELFYESGLNCIRLTGGGYSWSTGMHKALADDFQQRGLYVYLQLGSHYPSADYFKLKDAWFVDHAGNTGVEDRKAWSISYSGQHWPQYSYISQPFRQQLEGDFTTYLKTFAGHTNVAGVILHNEPGYFWQADRLFDYNPATIAAWRVWLQKQHGDIATLNTRWGTAHKTFDEITPPGKPPVQNVAAWMDWRRFHPAAIADFMTWESSFFKSQRADVPRTTNLAGPLDHWFAFRCADNYACSKPMDVVGIDIYPTQWSSRVLVPYTMDISTGVGAGRDVHVLECDVFAEKQWKAYSESQRADMLRGELWTMVGHGARAILMWGFSRGDAFSLTNGDKNDRYLAVQRMAGQLKLMGIDSFRRPAAQVAVCVDPDSYIYAAASEEKTHQLTPQEDAEAHGLYSTLADSHIPADVIFTAQLTDGVTSRYKAIVLAGAKLMDEKTAAALKAFVDGGGTLIADAPLATHDRWGNAFEKPLLDDLVTGQRRLGERAGVSYMNSSRGAAVRDQVAALVAPLLSGPRAMASDARANVSLLQDHRGNLLVVGSTLGQKGQLAPEIDNLTLTITGAQNIAKAYLLTNATDDAKLYRELEITSAANDLTVNVGKLTSAAAVILVKENDQLLQSFR